MGAWTETWICCHALSLWLCHVACGNLAVSYVNSHLNIYQVNHRTTCAMASIAMLVCWRVDVEVLVHPFFIQHGNRSNIHMIWDPIVQVPCWINLSCSKSTIQGTYLPFSDEFSVAESVWWVRFGSGKLQDLYLKTDESIIQNHQKIITKWKKLQFFRSFTGSWDFFDKIYTLWGV